LIILSIHAMTESHGMNFQRQSHRVLPLIQSPGFIHAMTQSHGMNSNANSKVMA